MKLLWILTLGVTLLSATPFKSGSVSLGVTVGSGSVAYSLGSVTKVENYYIAGVSGDYFVFENLSLGLGYRGWFGGSPTIHQLTTPITYYIPTGTQYRPYLGALYRYTYFDGSVEDYNSVGARAGLAILFRKGYIGFGWVHEYRLDADDLTDNQSGYPEVMVGFSF